METQTISLLTCAGAGLIFLFATISIIVWRYLNYREALALAERGLVPVDKNKDGKATLRWGIAISAVGLALCLGLYPLGASFNDIYPYGLGPWMLLGLVPLFFGLSLILIYVLTYDRHEK
jgi:Domain of unknown function (DUF6249)